MTNLVLILMLANCGDLIVKSLMKLLKETLESLSEWNKNIALIFLLLLIN